MPWAAKAVAQAIVRAGTQETAAPASPVVTGRALLRRILDWHHWCPFCARWFRNPAVPDAQFSCPRCKATGFERYAREHRDRMETQS